MNKVMLKSFFKDLSDIKNNPYGIIILDKETSFIKNQFCLGNADAGTAYHCHNKRNKLFLSKASAEYPWRK